MPSYVFRERGPVFVRDRKKADPQKIGEELEKAREATPDGGDMRETAIERARGRKNYLHGFLEWNDEKAGHQHRLTQINQLLCSIRRTDVEEDEEVHAFVSVTPHRERKRFATPEEIVNSAGIQMAILDAAERDLRSFQERYRQLRDICEDISRARERIRERRRDLDGDPASAA